MTADQSASRLGPGEVVLAFDVGGTDTKSALIDREGRVLGLRRTPTPHDGDRTASAVVKSVVELASDLKSAHPDCEPVAVGLVVPGVVDVERGIAVYSGNMGWRNEPIRDLATVALGLPVAFHHDVSAASWAEHRLGAARAFRDAVVLVIGTGIAGSLILDGRPYLGGGYAGEIGHSPVAEGPDCICGGRGCLEAIASAGAIARRYTASTGVSVSGASDVLARAKAGDSVAKEVWDSAIDALAFAIAQLVATVSPEAIVIGGGLSRAGDDLLVPLAARVDERLSYHRRPLLVAAQLGGDAGLLGAAIRARERATA